MAIRLPPSPWATMGRAALPEGEERPLEVGALDPAELLQRGLEEPGAAPADAGVGDAGVDPAQLLDRAGHGPHHRVLVGTSTEMPRVRTPTAASSSAAVATGLGTSAPEAHGAARRGEGAGHGQADAGAAAGDDGDLAGEVEGGGAAAMGSSAAQA